MSIGILVQAWRLARNYSTDALATKAGLAVAMLDAIESETLDPTVSAIESLATALDIPPAWLYANPKEIDLLFQDTGEEDEENALHPVGSDPIGQSIWRGIRQHRSLYVLLTALVQSDEPKLLRAAEMSLRSLVKQSRQATVPWQSRPPGHFEPPSD